MNETPSKARVAARVVIYLTCKKTIITAVSKTFLQFSVKVGDIVYHLLLCNTFRSLLPYTEFGDLSAVNLFLLVFRSVKGCGLVVRYQCFRGK
jgi:hypothetical protein